MGGVWNQHKVYPYVTDILNETNIIKVNTDYAANVNTVVAEFRNEILTGTIQMTDATWAKYLNDLNTAGYSAMHDEYQKMRKTADLLAEYGG
jgi:predicted glycosyltransferase